MIYLIVLLSTSLLCLGTYEVIHQLYFTIKGKQLQPNGGKYDKILKPILYCPACFASLWGATYYILLSFVLNYEPNLIWLALNSIALCFVNDFLHQIHSKL